ncbi:beta-phosphoglucomutase family hydrolase [Clostridium acetobutylicum]|uniref:Predicted phosphatase n=1 Tax=Clostridium acetobutylicum (strain ATCC 824 / DSM 792 / JCM 1419 / IAM 19013 / LMG 5710 / NBRC 13948 / NRRL B-527 / VKM B-1787 / 2291 / W) TaxID=272562 RepID=Q97KR2_CLOAB|nr:MULTISPECIES: HAD family hydrolase [Clostridium]AAK78831.1 Predicted phosphatase [Clostridium acetobutylicum ATCC 824]ADZ19906.1 phosphatase [Clostridium acetobutylicum EA 2018]AEI33174.1 phosphatase [Clostridium acetobutylicum DSM 1731]AWV80550.1 HAD family hydrolase [Clostridium acetobutylicum]MBC2392740.1 HAD family hydrolase [Clostridium acetobutylicum]
MRAFIFDMDGVIINSQPIHYEVDTMIFKKLGIVLKKEEMEGFAGMTNPEILRVLKEKFKFEENIDDVLKEQIRIKTNLLKQRKIKPIEGIIELVDKLKDKNILIAVASSSPRKFIEAVLETFGIIERFDKIICGEEVPKGKPEPDIYIEAARQLGVNIEECVVLEDSTHGIAAAKAAGMKCIGFRNPDSGSQVHSKADIVVNSIREIDIEAI